MGCVALLDKNAQTLVEQFRDAQEAIVRVWHGQVDQWW